MRGTAGDSTATNAQTVGMMTRKIDWDRQRGRDRIDSGGYTRHDDESSV